MDAVEVTRCRIYQSGNVAFLDAQIMRSRVRGAAKRIRDRKSQNTAKKQTHFTKPGGGRQCGKSSWPESHCAGIAKDLERSQPLRKLTTSFHIRVTSGCFMTQAICSRSATAATRKRRRAKTEVFDARGDPMKSIASKHRNARPEGDGGQISGTFVKPERAGGWREKNSRIGFFRGRACARDDGRNRTTGRLNRGI